MGVEGEVASLRFRRRRLRLLLRTRRETKVRPAKTAGRLICLKREISKASVSLQGNRGLPVAMRCLRKNIGRQRGGRLAEVRRSGNSTGNSARSLAKRPCSRPCDRGRRSEAGQRSCEATSRQCGAFSKKASAVRKSWAGVARENAESEDRRMQRNSYSRAKGGVAKSLRGLARRPIGSRTRATAK